MRLSCHVSCHSTDSLHTTTGHSPAELLLGRQPRSRLDLLYPDVSGRVQESQARQQRAHDSHSRARAFQVRDRVYVRNFLGCPVWMEGTILDKTGHFEFGCQMDVSGSAILINQVPRGLDCPEALVGPEQFSARL